MSIKTQDEIVSSINLDTVLPEEVNEKESIDPTFFETSKAAFERENLLFGTIKDRKISDENFDPFAAISGTKYEPMARSFIYADTLDEVEQVKASIDKEIENNQILEESGWTGIAMQMVAGTLDPTILIPGAKAVRAGSKITRVAKAATAGASLGTAAIAAQEALLQQQQEIRPIEESVYATMAGGIFGGVLGGAASVMSKSNKALGDVLTESIVRDQDIKIKLDDSGKAVGVEMRSASAAEVDPRILRQEEGIADLNEKIIKTLTLTTEGGGLGTPLSQGLTSKSGIVRQLTNNLFEHNFILGKNKKFIASDEAMETILKVDTAKAIKLNKEIENLYIKSVGLEGKNFAKWRALKGAQTGKSAKFQDFSQEVAKALRRGTKSDIPEVDQAAKLLRQEMDLQAQKLIDNKILEGVDPEVAKNYLTRRWNVDQIAARREEFEAKLVADFQKKNPDIDIEDLQLSASNTTDNILGLGDETLQIAEVSKSIMTSKSGKFTKGRVLDIDDTKYEEFLNNDGVGNALSYITQANNLNRFQETLQRMGYESLADMKKAVRSEMESLARVEDVKLTDIQKSIKLIDQQAGIMLGQFGSKRVTDDAFRVLRKYQTVRLLGGVTISSMPDMAMPIFKHGLGRTLRDGYGPLIRNMKKAKLARDQWSDFNVGLELEQNELLKNLVDPDFSVGRARNAAERYSDVAVQTFGNITGMNYWNRFGKRLAAHMSSARTIRDLKKLAKGEKLKQKEINRLASLGINENMGERILKEFDKYGQIEQGSFVANIHKWTDKEAKSIFGKSVLKDADSTIITPGRGDMPVIVQQSEIGKTIFQFKSFVSAATNQILLSGLQRRDAEALAGLSALVSMGALTYNIKEQISGRKPDNSFDKALKEGIARSGVAGLMGDLAFITVPGLNSSRFASYNTKDAMLGPTFSQLSDAPDMFNRMADGELSDSDKKKMFRWLPMHNLFYLRILYDQVNKDKQ